MFACLVGDGYTNLSEKSDLYCIFNRNADACRYGIGIGILAFLACIFFFMVDVYFPQISNTTDRKYLVLADLGFSGTRGAGRAVAVPQWPPCPVTWLRCLAKGVAPVWRSARGPRAAAASAAAECPGSGCPWPGACASPHGAAGSGPGTAREQQDQPWPLMPLPPTGLWTFLWFIGFCFLTNQWSWTQPGDVYIGADSARAAITFSFFSIFSWVSEPLCPTWEERRGAPCTPQPGMALMLLPPSLCSVSCSPSLTRGTKWGWRTLLKVMPTPARRFRLPTPAIPTSAMRATSSRPSRTQRRRRRVISHHQCTEPWLAPTARLHQCNSFCGVGGRV